MFRNFWIRLTRYAKYRIQSNRLDIKFVERIAAVADQRAVMLNVIGFIRYNYSASIDMRRFILLLQKTSVSFCSLPLINTKKQAVINNGADSQGFKLASKALAPLNLFFVNADHIESVYQRNKELFKNHYNIAVFWWEFPDYFYFHDAFKHIDEVVVYSQLVYDAIIKVKPSKLKLTKLTYPFVLPEVKLFVQESRKELALPQDKFLVLFNFDVHSSTERKNPQAVIDVIKQALPQIPKLHLLLKISNYDHWRAECIELETYLNSSGVKDSCSIILDSLSDSEMRHLINSCDVYISLHRTEGLGLGMLEAMSLGKPVIATRFGGNLEFMNDDNSILIDYDLCEVKQSFASYKKGYLWASPKVDQASNALIELFSNPEFYQQKAQNAQLSIAQKYQADKIVAEIDQFIRSRNS